MDFDFCVVVFYLEEYFFSCKRCRIVEDFNKFCIFVLVYVGYIFYFKEEFFLRSSFSFVNSIVGIIDSDGWDVGFLDIVFLVFLLVFDCCFSYL